MIKRKEIVDQIAGELMISKLSVDRVLTRLFPLIAEYVHRGEEVEFPCFGRFFRRRARAMTSKDIRTGEPRDYPARDVFGFRASSKIKACPVISAES